MNNNKNNQLKEAKPSAKVSSLYLNTSMISTTANQASATSSTGYWINGRQQFGFNVNMRQLLGNMYEKYDKFIISLVKYSYYTENVSMAGNLLVDIQMGGLSWVDGGYEAPTKSNSYWVTLDQQLIAAAFTSFGTSTYADDGKVFIFKKGDPDVLLEFRLVNSLTRGLAIPPSGRLSSFAFDFKIRPLIEN